MGFIDKIFRSAKNVVYVYYPPSPEESWLGILYAVMTVDGEISESKAKCFNRIISSKSMFKGHDVALYYENAIYARTRTGSRDMIYNCKTKITMRHDQEALFAAAVELVFCDGVLKVEETGILTYLAEAFELKKSLTDIVVKLMQAGHAGNVEA